MSLPFIHALRLDCATPMALAAALPDIFKRCNRRSKEAPSPTYLFFPPPRPVLFDNEGVEGVDEAEYADESSDNAEEEEAEDGDNTEEDESEPPAPSAPSPSDPSK